MKRVTVKFPADDPIVDVPFLSFMQQVHVPLGPVGEPIAIRDGFIDVTGTQGGRVTLEEIRSVTNLGTHQYRFELVSGNAIEGRPDMSGEMVVRAVIDGSPEDIGFYHTSKIEITEEP